MLVVYNTCGIKRDNTDWYIESINSLLNQDFEGYRVVFSSCLNSPECFKEVYSTFKDKISYCYHTDPHTVNITFNKAIQESVKHFGEFEGYLYVDSGCSFEDQTNVISSVYECFKSGPYGIVAVQTDTDEALHVLDPDKFVYQTPEIQVKDEDYVVPIGKSINQHVHLFSNEIYKKYNKIHPDIFAAFCSESTFNYVAASVKQKWVIMKDLQVRHLHSLDGASACASFVSEKHSNMWNNLLYDRDATEFVNDKEAYEAGLGYEECNNIMQHNPEAYDEDGYIKDPDRLTSVVNKYLFLSKEELDYDEMRCKFIP